MNHVSVPEVYLIAGGVLVLMAFLALWLWQNNIIVTSSQYEEFGWSEAESMAVQADLLQAELDGWKLYAENTELQLLGQDFVTYTQDYAGATISYSGPHRLAAAYLGITDEVQPKDAA